MNQSLGFLRIKSINDNHLNLQLVWTFKLVNCVICSNKPLYSQCSIISMYATNWHPNSWNVCLCAKNCTTNRQIANANIPELSLLSCFHKQSPCLSVCHLFYQSASLTVSVCLCHWLFSRILSPLLQSFIISPFLHFPTYHFLMRCSRAFPLSDWWFLSVLLPSYFAFSCLFHRYNFTCFK